MYNGILPSHKEEENSVICRDTHDPRHWHAQWSKSEIEKQVSHSNIEMGNLEKWYRWSYSQSRNRGTMYIKNVCIPRETDRVEWIGRLGLINIYTTCIKQIASKNFLYSTGNFTQNSMVTQMGRKSKKEGISISINIYTYILTQQCKATIFQFLKK